MSKFAYSCGAASSKKCPPDLSQPGTATDFCKKAEQKADNIWSVAKDAIAANPVSAIINAIGGKSKSDQELLTRLDINLDTTSLAKSMQNCVNLVNNEQVNEIDDTDCFETAMKYASTPEEREALQKGMSLNKIDQSNTSKNLQTCQLSAMSKALTDMAASVDNSALQSVLAKAKGVGAATDGKQRTCNDISQSMSACKWVSQQQCCNNVLNNKQRNILKACGAASNINQANDARTVQTCATAATSSISDSLVSTIVNKTSQSATLEATGFPVGALVAAAIVLLILVASPVILPVVASGAAASKMMAVAGPLLVIVGGVLSAVYFVKKRGAIDGNNAPLSTCEPSVCATLEPERMTFGALQARVQGDDTIAGYDFFMDDLRKKKPLPGDRGLAILFTSVSAASGCPVDPDTCKCNVITHVKPHSTPAFIVIGALCVLAGIVQIVLARRYGGKVATPVGSPS